MTYIECLYRNTALSIGAGQSGPTLPAGRKLVDGVSPRSVQSAWMGPPGWIRLDTMQVDYVQV